MTTATELKPSKTAPRAEPDSPGVIIFPPVLPIGTLFLGLLLQFFWPLHLSSEHWPRIPGLLLMVTCGPVAPWAFRTMKRAGTNVLPDKPSLVIVTDGPFRFTRNPIYVANSLVYLGLALICNALWPVILFAPMLMVLYWGIVRREERYLEAKFGATYLDYKARVPRWL
jgi:protein-S-isoprenylcysteine O-methyltransferase Ste14